MIFFSYQHRRTYASAGRLHVIHLQSKSIRSYWSQLRKKLVELLGSFDMLFLVLQANYFEKISLILIFSLVNPNAPGLLHKC